MSWIHFSILEIDKKLDDFDRELSQIPDKIAKTNQDREKLETALISFKEQLEAFILAENELVNQIEHLLEKKKEQIVHETHLIYRDQNFENLHDRVNELSQQINLKEQAI